MWGLFETLTVVCVLNILFGGKYFLNQQMNWLPLGHAIFTVLKNGLAHCSVGGWAAVCNYSHTCGPQVRQGWGVWLQAAHRRIPLTSQTTPNGNVLKEMGRVKRFLKNRKVSHAHKIPLPWKFFTHTGPWGGGRFPWTGFWPLSRRLVILTMASHFFMGYSRRLRGGKRKDLLHSEVAWRNSPCLMPANPGA